MKWKTIIALIPLIIAIVMQWWWFFTILFIIQIIFAWIYGSIEYVEEVKRSENPILYWVIMGIWVFLAGYSVSPYIIG